MLFIYSTWKQVFLLLNFCQILDILTAKSDVERNAVIEDFLANGLGGSKHKCWISTFEKLKTLDKKFRQNEAHDLETDDRYVKVVNVTWFPLIFMPYFKRFSSVV